MRKLSAVIIILMTLRYSVSVAQETQPHQSQAKDPYTNLFYGNMFFRNTPSFQGSPPETRGGSIQTQYFYGPDGSLQGYSIQSGDTSQHYSGDGNYRGTSYKKSSDENFYSLDHAMKNGSHFEER
jgi:hypothetical protein